VRPEDLIRKLDADLRKLDTLDRAFYTNRRPNAEDRAAYQHRKEERAELMDKFYEAIASSGRAPQNTCSSCVVPNCLAFRSILNRQATFCHADIAPRRPRAAKTMITSGDVFALGCNLSIHRL